MMCIDITINDRDRVATINVVNHGPVGGADGSSYEAGDGPGGDGLRRYRWTAGASAGEVVHRRGDGAAALAALVCNELAGAFAAVVE